MLERAELGRLRWRCRRGSRELDELLTDYLDRGFPSASPAEQRAFQSLLEERDDLINAYCLGVQRPAAPDLRALVERITTRSYPES